MIGLVAIVISVGVFILAINVIYTTLKERRHDREEKLKEQAYKDLELLKEEILEEFKSDNDVQPDRSYKQVKSLRKEFMKRVKEFQNKK